MAELPVSYAAAALYGFDIESDVPDFMEEYERAEDAAIAREQDEAQLIEDRGFAYPCLLRDTLE